MVQDKLSELEEIEFYKARLKGKTGFTIVVAGLKFVIGFVLARLIYHCNGCFIIGQANKYYLNLHLTFAYNS